MKAYSNQCHGESSLTYSAYMAQGYIRLQIRIAQCGKKYACVLKNLFLFDKYSLFLLLSLALALTNKIKKKRNIQCLISHSQPCNTINK